MSVHETTLNHLVTMLAETNKKIDNMQTDIVKTRTDLGTTKADLTLSISDQTKTLDAYLRKGIEEAIAPLAKKQEEMEAKSEAREAKTDKKLAELEDTLATKQDTCDKKYEARLAAIEEQLSADQGKPKNPPYNLSFPPHPTALPFPLFPDPTLQPSQEHKNSSDLDTIKEMVSNARTILGFGPISSEDIAEADGLNPEQKLFSAAVDFLRNELAVKEEEISDDDIIKVFSAAESELQRVYVQFRSVGQADLCLHLTRQLRKPELKVVLYVPREFKQRFLAMKTEDYRLRRLTETKHKTRIEYSESDLVLYACPAGQYRFAIHPIPDLPSVDLHPARTPPQGRKSKREKRARPDSDSSSPKGADPKNARVNSPATAAAQGRETGQSQQSGDVNTEQHLN